MTISQKKSLQKLLYGVNKLGIEKDKSFYYMPKMGQNHINKELNNLKRNRVFEDKEISLLKNIFLDQIQFSTNLNQKQKPFIILSIDGGGTRGIIPAVILKEIERKSGKKITELFDRIVGTSTGSILACGLNVPQSNGSNSPKYSSDDIISLYRNLGRKIFERGPFESRIKNALDEIINLHWGLTNTNSNVKKVIKNAKLIKRLITNPAHDIYKLAYYLKQNMGDFSMKDSITELFVYAYDINSRTPIVMGSKESSIPGSGGDYSNYKLWQCSCASSAGVPFFAPFYMYKNNPDIIRQNISVLTTSYNTYSPKNTGEYKRLIDGGNCALGNPALFSQVEEVTSGNSGRPTVLVSLGTGHTQAPVPVGSSDWGFLEWLVDGGFLLSNLLDGSSDVIDMALRASLITNSSYFRLQPTIPNILNHMDEGSPANMQYLEGQAQNLINSQSQMIDDLIAAVVG